MVNPKDINERTTMDVDIPHISLSCANARYELSHKARGFGESVSISLVERPLYALLDLPF